MSNWIRTIDGFLLKVDSRLPVCPSDYHEAELLAKLTEARADLACAAKELSDLRTAYSRLVAMHDDTPKRDHIGPDDAPHRRVHDVIGDLTAGRVTEPARKGLRDALDKADAPPPRRLPDGTHRAPDGRVFRFGAARVGFWVP